MVPLGLLKLIAHQQLAIYICVATFPHLFSTIYTPYFVRQFPRRRRFSKNRSENLI